MGVFFAIAVAVGFYLALEFFATESALRQIGKPVSGVESAKGRQVTVISVFEQGSDGANPEGRIRMDGESWKAILDAGAQTVPELGDRVTVLEIDAAKLVVRVK